MAPDVRILKTEDGSLTLYLEELQETYHSIHGALSESLHVYIRHGLDLLRQDLDHVRILEVGFGTGLNVLLTLDHAQEPRAIDFYSIEPYPLDQSLLSDYYQGFDKRPASFDLLPMLITDPGILHKIRQGFNFCLVPKKLEELDGHDVDGALFDLIYYDAFAPSRQPDMWSLETLEIVVNRMNIGGILTTYCAQGQFKRHLKKLGLTVENPPGANGKREMTIARKA